MEMFRGSARQDVIPWSRSIADQDPGAENRGGDVGYHVLTLNFASVPTGRPVRMFKGAHFGFAIVSVTDPAIANLTFYLTRPRGGVTGTPFSTDLKLQSVSSEPMGDEIWYTKTSAEAITVTLAIFLRPMVAPDFGTRSTLFTPIQWASFAPITVNAADVSIAAASTTRRGLSLYNSSTAGQFIAITDENPATAINRGIVFLAAGIGAIFGPSDGTTRQALRAFGSAAGGSISGAVGV